MATRRKSRKSKSTKSRTRTRRRRRARAVTVAPKRRSRRRRRARGLKASGRIRPVVIVSGGGFKRPKRSKYFPHPTRINRRRRRRRNPFGARMNPMNLGSFKKAMTARNIVRYVAVGGGILAGTLLSRFLNTGALPFMNPPAATPGWVATVSKARPVHGLIHILAGILLVNKAKNAKVKDIGLGLAALGGFDLLMQVLALAGLKGLPTFSGMNVTMLGANLEARRPMTVLAGGMGAGMTEDLRELIPI